MKSKYVDYQSAVSLHVLLHQKLYYDQICTLDKQILFLKNIGVKPCLGWGTHWFDMFEEKSYLSIINPKRWLLAKIKYGI